MDTNRHEFDDNLLHGEVVFSIVGAAMEVLRTMGPGIWEKPYERALTVELRLRNHTLDQQRKFDLSYKGHHVGEYIPDLIVDDAVIVETKVVDHITDYERAQLLNYLRITRLRVGLIINFKKRKLDWQRLIL